MQLKQLKGIIRGKAILMSGCIGYGRYIGELSDELYEEYKNCKVKRIERGCGSGFPIEIVISVSKTKLKRLCNTCNWETCPDSPNFIDQI